MRPEREAVPRHLAARGMPTEIDIPVSSSVLIFTKCILYRRLVRYARYQLPRSELS